MFDASIFLAKAFGLYMLIVGVIFLFNQKMYQRIVEDFAKNSALVFFMGVMVLILGILLVISHNVWVANWRVIITFFSWATFLKGVMFLMFPEQFLMWWVNKVVKNKNLISMMLLVVIILGFWLSYLGFITG